MSRTKVVVVGGAILAVIGMVMSYLYTSRAAHTPPDSAGTGDETGSLAYVAIGDIAVGTPWEEMAGLVEKRRVPDALRPPQAISGEGDVKGKRLVRSMSRGEILTSVQFNESGAESLQIPEGHSALTMSVPLPQGVGDYIQPGSKANIFVTFKGVPGGDPLDGTLTRLLLSNVTVLANRRALPAPQAEGAAPPNTGDEVLLTLAVTIDQAERIIFAKENGAVWLTLMRPGDPAGVGIGRNFKTVLV